MRIVGGKLSSRVLFAPEGKTTRPTSDRVRESVFNILAHHDWGEEIGNPFQGTVILDAFCGTGALAFEGLSWGASKAFLFDTDRQALGVARENAAQLGLSEAVFISQTDATSPSEAEQPARLVFLDPPYKKDLIPTALGALNEKGWIAENALIVAESAKNEKILWPNGFSLLLSRAYGDTEVHFLAKVSA